MAGVFGPIPGVPVGSALASRREAANAGVHRPLQAGIREAANAGVHRPLQAGISGGSQAGAESIVVSGGYEDDEDHARSQL
jgi:putative restriction endonuclease